MDCTVFLPGNDDDDEEEEEENDNDGSKTLFTESVWGRGPPIRNFFGGETNFRKGGRGVSP